MRGIVKASEADYTVSKNIIDYEIDPNTVTFMDNPVILLNSIIGYVS